MKKQNLLIKSSVVKIGIFLFGFVVIASRAELKVALGWRYIEWQYNSTEEEAEAIQSGAYDYKTNIPVDVDVGPDGRTWVSLVRAKGVPASLAEILYDTRGFGGGPLLKPYPDWSWTDVNNCESLISVNRIAIDECNRLWAIDSGKVSDKFVCPPKVVVFDIVANQLLWSLPIPEHLAYGENGESSFLNIVVDATVYYDCMNTKVYMADSEGNGLVIWNNGTWSRLQSPYFDPQADASTFSVVGDETIQMTRGLFGMSLTLKEFDEGDRVLYFRPLSSYDMSLVHVTELLDEDNTEGEITYKTEPTQLKGQAAGQAFSKEGILFYSSLTDSSVICWNFNKPLLPENTAIVAINEELLQWPESVKVISVDEDGWPSNGTLWVLSNRWQRYYNRDMDFEQTNFRILTGSIEDLVNNTVCA